MDKIFGHFICRETDTAEDASKRLAYASWFVNSIPCSEFVADEALFWQYLSYCDKLGACAKSKYFDIWLKTELRQVLRVTNARVPGTEALRFDEPVAFETAVKVTTEVLSADFNVLEQEPQAVEDFLVDVSAFFTKKRSERLTVALSDTYEKLNSTDSSVEASDFAMDTISCINDIYNTEKLEDLGQPSTLSKKREKIADFNLPAIDNDSDGLWGGQLLGIEAQPGTGKTRFAIGAPCYTAATKYHKNVLYLSLEQPKEEIDAMFIARHVFQMFNVQLNDKMIWQEKVPNEYVEMVEAAKFDLFESGNYGKIVCIETPLYVENFISKLRNWDKLRGPFDLICIDYMGLIGSKPLPYQREKIKADIIAQAFETFKGYVRATRKAGIAISQFNRDGIAAGKADKEITTEMAQGGITVYRNTDYNIAISMTDTMRLQQKRRFSQPKVRASAGFGSFIADTRLGFCYFRQVVQKSV